MTKGGEFYLIRLFIKLCTYIYELVIKEKKY